MGNARKAKGAELSFSGVSVRWGCAGAFAWLGFLPGAGNRSQDFYLLGKTEVRRGHTPGKNRVRARNGEEKDRVRVFAHRRCARRRRGLSACLGKQKSGAGTRPERIACVRGMAKKKTGCASCSPQPRGRARHGEEKDEANRFADIRRTKSCIAGDEPADTDSSAPGRRVRVVPAAGAGFLPARENRSPAWARTRKQPRACETRRRNKHGARLARRSRANCPPQVRRRAGELGKGEL